MDVRKSIVCNIKKDKGNFKNGRNLCKNCYNIKRKKYKNNNKEKIKVVNSENIINIKKKENKTC